MSTDAHLTALKSFVTAAAKVAAYDVDDLQAMTTKPAQYVEVYLARRYGGNMRGGMQDTRRRRFSTRVVASSVTNGRLIEDRIFDAFEFAIVNLGDTTAHLAFESGDAGRFAHDSGKYVGDLVDWTFTI